MNAPLPRPVTVRYLVWLAGLLIAGMAGVVGINALVDPSGTVGLVNISGFNAEKTKRFSSGSRVERSLRLWLDQYDTVILGSSRARAGLDPSRPLLKPLRAYNASFAGTNMAEIYWVGRFVLEHQRLSRIIIGLDFLMFTSRRGLRGDFEASGFAGNPMPYVLARSLFNHRSLSASFTTVVDNMLGSQSRQHASGHKDISPARGKRRNYRKAFIKTFEGFVANPQTYGDYDYDYGRLMLLKDLLTRFADAGLSIHLFISPVHARQIEAIAAAGLYQTFERWKRDLAVLVDQVNTGPAEARPIALWDFSGYNSIATERVPAMDEKSEMIWYWDSSHYKPAMGDLVVARMLNLDRDVARPPEDFGVRLSQATVDSVIQGMREGRRSYRRSHPDEVADMARSIELKTAKRRTSSIEAGTHGHP